MRDLMATFHRAGIHTVMVTGDQAATGRTVARQLGLSANGEVEIVDAAELERLPPDEPAAAARRAHVFARVSPAQKLQIVRALQRAGAVVAMTGDGVNDSPALKAADTGHLVFSTLHTTDATQTIARVLSFYPPHQAAEVRFSLSSALAAVVSLRLVPRKDRPGRVPACEVLINTASVRDNIRDMTKSLNIPDLIKEGTVQYGMQSFDQSLMSWYTKGVISYENAMFYSSNPSEFALRVQGVAASSDTTWDAFQADANA